MTEALVPQTALRRAAARSGGINALCRELRVTRQSFYLWEKDGGATPLFAILMARLTGIDEHDLCRAHDWPTLDLIADYYHTRG